MKLYAHQQKLLDDNPSRHALVWGTGTGKSLASIELANKKRRNVLIICPKALKLKWHEDMKQYSKVSWKIYSKEEFKKIWKTLEPLETTIVDEAHYFFGTKSQLMKSLKAYFKRWSIPYRYFLTATAYRSSPMDIFVMSDLLGRPMNYPEFFRRFFYSVQMGRRLVPVVRSDAEEDVAAIVRELGSTVKLEECVDMPEQVFEVEHLSLTKEQERAMKAVPDVLPIVRFTKYHQICGGTLKGDEYTEAKTFKADKMERIKEFALSNDKMIIVSRYNHEGEEIFHQLNDMRMGHQIFRIHGGVSGEDRHFYLEEMRKAKKYILVVNAACSEGWELPDCPLMVFYSLDFSLKNYIQMLGRIQRINNIKRNVYKFLIVKDTIDEEVYKSLKNKEDFHIAIYARTTIPNFV